MLPGSGPPGRPKPTRIKWDFTTQHTISWDEPICVYMHDDEVNDMVAVTIRPGSCNLYMFPKVFWKTPSAPKGKGLGALISSAVAANKKPFEVLDGSYLKVLQMIFRLIAESPTERDILKIGDSSGAFTMTPTQLGAETDGETTAVAVADLNKDGLNDILVANYDRANGVFLGSYPSYNIKAGLPTAEPTPIGGGVYGPTPEAWEYSVIAADWQ